MGGRLLLVNRNREGYDNWVVRNYVDEEMMG
jgi:hypothetical protein